MDIKDVDKKVVDLINVAIEEIKKAYTNSYNFKSPDLARSQMSKAEGILGTIKALLE